MTRTEQVLYQSRHLLWMTAALLILGGGVSLSLILIHREATAREQVAHEADLRGAAVSTLAGNVRELRAQIQAAGKKPVAPDPAKAVEDLPDRAAVPVPRPGPSGPPGKEGRPGKPGPTITPSPGPQGSPGARALTRPCRGLPRRCRVRPVRRALRGRTARTGPTERTGRRSARTGTRGRRRPMTRTR